MMTAPVQDGKIGVRVGVCSYAKTPSVPSHCHPGRRQPIRDPQPQSPLGSPLCATASAGMTWQGISPLPLGEGTGVRALHSPCWRARCGGL